MTRRSRAAIGIATLCVGACAPGEQGAAAAAIMGLSDGDTISAPFTVQLSATGVVIVPATGIREAGKGHHHLIIDGEVPPDSLPLPSPPAAIHLGTGVSEYRVDSLAPGPHRLIAIVAFGDHVPIPGVKRDTVTIIMR
jgi:hypothetical protein